MGGVNLTGAARCQCAQIDIKRAVHGEQASSVQMRGKHHAYARISHAAALQLVQPLGPALVLVLIFMVRYAAALRLLQPFGPAWCSSSPSCRPDGRRTLPMRHSTSSAELGEQASSEWSVCLLTAHARATQPSATRRGRNVGDGRAFDPRGRVVPVVAGCL